MFTKQHYKAIAKIIRKRIEYHLLPMNRDISDGVSIAMDLADYFATNNKLFDRDKFLKDCKGGVK